MSQKPIVMISSYPPRLCGIGTFTEEAREFIQKVNPDREVLVISHVDGRGEGVYPIIDLNRRDWWKPVAKKIEELNPWVVHLEHEYGLYEYKDDRGIGDGNEGFLNLLDAIGDFPIVVEPHTVHGRLRDFEANFIYRLSQRVDVLILKCHYQKWRLEWTLPAYGWEVPKNIMVIPHGARPDKVWNPEEVKKLRKELGLSIENGIAPHIVGMIGWIQSNKRWDILLTMWKDIHDEILRRTGEEWDLLAAGAMRDPNHKVEYEKWKEQTLELQNKGIAHYYEFIPRGDIYYKVMAVCDFIVLPSIDETQSGTLARIIALRKPYITTAPMEGLTAQTLESEGGLLFTTREMLRKKVIRLATDENLRKELTENLDKYLKNIVSWEKVAQQYNEAYKLARWAKEEGKRIELSKEF